VFIVMIQGTPLWSSVLISTLWCDQISQLKHPHIV